jgi:hypothetical protein
VRGTLCVGVYDSTMVLVLVIIEWYVLISAINCCYGTVIVWKEKRKGTKIGESTWIPMAQEKYKKIKMRFQGRVDCRQKCLVNMHLSPRPFATTAPGIRRVNG